MEILKVKGDTHTDLTGFQQVEQTYDLSLYPIPWCDSVPEKYRETVDSFRIVRKLDSGTDGEGRCYDWYEIDHHNRTIDKSAPVAARVEAIETAIERGLNL